MMDGTKFVSVSAIWPDKAVIAKKVVIEERKCQSY